MNNNPTRIFFIRHGITEQTGKILYGQSLGIDLSDEGIRQAKYTSEYLKSIEIDRIYSSPLERAIQTAEQIALNQNCEIEIQQKLIDTDIGLFTNLSLKQAAKKPEWKDVISRPSQFKFEDGESFQDVFVRMNKLVSEIVEKHKGESIAITAHRDPIIIMMAHYLGLHMDLFQRIPCAPASVSIVNFSGSHLEVKGIGILPPVRMEE